MTQFKTTARHSIALVALVGAALQSCRPTAEDARHDSAVSSVGTVADAPGLNLDTVGHGADLLAVTDPDQRFLRWMLSHHAEVVYLAHQAARHRDSATIRDVARRVDQSHDAETARMRNMLRDEFGDTTSPGIRREHVGMVTPFASMSGDAYGSAFRSFLISHHSEALKMIDSTFSQLRRTSVRSLAQEIRRTRTGDIEALRQTPDRRAQR